MKLLNEGIYFEKSGDGFVYRPTLLSAGFSISRAQKDQLFAAFKRLERRFFIAGIAALLLVAGAFWSGLVTSPTPIPWFILISLAAVIVLALATVRRKRRAVEAILGHYTPDVPRLPLAVALSRPRPLLARRFALPVLRSVIVLFALVTALFDLLALTPLLAVLLPQRIVARAAGSDAIGEALAHTLYSPVYWAVVALANVALLACIWLLLGELRRLRDYRDPGEPDSDTPAR